MSGLTELVAVSGPLDGVIVQPGYAERLISLLGEQAVSAKVLGRCTLQDGVEETVGIMLTDGTELYVTVQGWPPGEEWKP